MSDESTSSPASRCLAPSLVMGSQNAGAGVLCEWCRSLFPCDKTVKDAHKLRGIATLSGRIFKALCLDCFRAQKKASKWAPEMIVPKVSAEFERMQSGEEPGTFTESIISDGWIAIREMEGRMKADLDALSELNRRLNFSKTAHAGLSGLYAKWLWDTYPERRKRANYSISRAALRLMVFSRDKYCCVTCGGGDCLSVDHKIAVLNGGSDDPDNLQTLCVKCNSKKGSA